MAEEKGYGIVMPSINDLKLEEPEIVKQGGRYGVRLRASAPSIHLMKANINGRGISRDSVNCVCYWDCEKGGFRSLRFENLLQVF